MARSSEFPGSMPHLLCLVTNRLDSSWCARSFTYLFICSSEPAPWEPLDPGSVRLSFYCVQRVKEGSPPKAVISRLLVLGEEFEAQQI